MIAAATCGHEDGDYINCPLNREEYEAFVTALLEAPRIPLKDADKELERYFEGCMPIEALGRPRRRCARLRSHAPSRAARPAHGSPALCRRAAAPGQRRRHALQPGRLPDQHPLGRAGRDPAHDSGTRGGGVRTSRPDASQHLHQQPHPATANAADPQREPTSSSPARSRAPKATSAAQWAGSWPASTWPDCWTGRSRWRCRPLP